MVQNTISNGFENRGQKSLNEMISEVVNSKACRRDKVQALIKLGIRENEIHFVLPIVPRVPSERFDFTFGVEIECCMPRHRFVEVAERNGVPYHYESYNHRDNREYFKFTTDSSIHADRNREGEPIECVSPVLDGNRGGFDKLALCCKSLNEAGAYVNRSTGLHVHIGAAGLTGEQYVNVFKNYQRLEDVIDTFMAESRRNSTWCHSLRCFDFSNCHNQRGVSAVMHNDRYHKVNPCAYEAHKTIEFRQHQGSTDYKKIKNWVNFCAKLVAYSMFNVIEKNITSISDIPFLTATEKRFFESRKAELSRSRAAA